MDTDKTSGDTGADGKAGQRTVLYFLLDLLSNYVRHCQIIFQLIAVCVAWHIGCNRCWLNHFICCFARMGRCTLKFCIRHQHDQ